jgi:hypothetical protein
MSVDSGPRLTDYGRLDGRDQLAGLLAVTTLVLGTLLLRVAVDGLGRWLAGQPTVPLFVAIASVAGVTAVLASLLYLKRVDEALREVRT